MDTLRTLSIDDFAALNLNDSRYFGVTEEGSLYEIKHDENGRKEKSSLSSVFDNLREKLTDDYVSCETLQKLKNVAQNRLEKAEEHLSTKTKNPLRIAWNSLKLFAAKVSLNKLTDAIDKKEKSMLPPQLLKEESKESEDLKWLYSVKIHPNFYKSNPENIKNSPKLFIQLQIKEIETELTALKPAEDKELIPKTASNKGTSRKIINLERALKKNQELLKSMEQK